jgi:hypothetical protein
MTTAARLSFANERDIPADWILSREAGPMLDVSSQQVAWVAQVHDLIRQKILLGRTPRTVYLRASVEGLARLLGRAGVPEAPSSVRKNPEEIMGRVKHIVEAYCHGVLNESEFRQKLSGV